MTSEDVEKVEAAMFAYREEGDSSVNAMLGILFVLRNRVKAGWHHGSWLENIAAAESYHPGQSTTLSFPDVRDPSFLQIVQLVDEVYDDRRPDNLTGGALHYARVALVDPGSKFAKEIMSDPENHPRTGNIGSTTFFK